MALYRAVSVLTLGLLAATARADLPWQTGRGSDIVWLRQSYLAIVSVGAQVGCHYWPTTYQRTSYPEGVAPAAFRLTVLEYRRFTGRFGAGISLLDCTFDPRWFAPIDAGAGSWFSYDYPPVYALGGLSLSFSYVTGATSRLFHYVTLQLDWGYSVEDFLHVPSLSYTLVPFPPLPVEVYARAGFPYAGVGARAGAGWWVMGED